MSDNDNPESTRRSDAHILIEKAPFFLVIAISSAITYTVQKKGGAVKSFEMFSLQDRFGNACIAYFAYLDKMIWLSGLAVYYPHPESVGSRSAVLALVPLIAISVLSVCMWRRWAYFPVGWFWSISTLIPVIGIVQAGSQAYADRYTYVPLTGIAISAAWGTHPGPVTTVHGTCP